MGEEQRFRPQSEATPWLLAGAGLASAVGIVAHWVARSEQTVETLGTLLSRTVTPGMWLWAATGTGVAVAAAAVVSALDLALPRPFVSRRGYDELSSANVRDGLLEVRARVDQCLQGEQLDISGAFDELLRGAVRMRASDLHLSPTSEGITATYRIDGTLQETATMSARAGGRMATRVKVLARLDTFAKRPQDGKLRHRVGESQVEARVSTLPADFGERVVLRIIRGGLAVPELEQLGFPESITEQLSEILTKPQGMLFVSGPVGSGKTTTLYSALQHIVSTRGKTTSLVTLEDPIELQLPFATQTQINAAVGMSFAQTLRSVLRQDPNVLMLGEIRDRETAEIASQAGLTGHLILTTLHVDSAAGTFARMAEMGVEPFVLASTATGSLAQRLVRTLCTHCRRQGDPEPLLKDRLIKVRGELPEARYFEAVGCEFCEGQGYTGRAPIAELLLPSAALRQAINGRRPTSEIHEIAVAEGMTPLIDAALTRAAAGETSLTEVVRVAG